MQLVACGSQAPLRFIRLRWPCYLPQASICWININRSAILWFFCAYCALAGKAHTWIVSDIMDATATFLAAALCTHRCAHHFSEGYQLLTAYALALAVAGLMIHSTRNKHRTTNGLRYAERRNATQQKSRALSQVAGGIAHEMNNNLASIIGHIDLSEELHCPEQTRHAHAQIRSASERSAVLVQHLLLAAGRARLVPQSCVADEIIAKLQSDLSGILAKGIRCTTRPVAKNLTLRVDPEALLEALSELCANACNAMGPYGTLMISAHLSHRVPGTPVGHSAEPPFVCFVIQDSGPGVSDAALGLLTEPFFTTKPTQSSSGLGLSAVAGFAEQSGGGLHLSNSKTGGLRAVLYLPAQRTQPSCA